MVYSELFSKRYRLRPTPEGLIYEDVPERARIGLYHLVEEYFGDRDQVKYGVLYREICVALRMKRDRRSDAMVSDYQKSHFIRKSDNEL